MPVKPIDARHRLHGAVVVLEPLAPGACPLEPRAGKDRRGGNRLQAKRLPCLVCGVVFFGLYALLLVVICVCGLLSVRKFKKLTK